MYGNKDEIAPSDVVRVQDEIRCRHSLQETRCALFQADAVWQLDHVLDGHCRVFCVRAGPAHKGYLIADLEIGDIRTDRVDDTRALAAERQRHGHGIETAPLVRVNVVDTGKVVPHDDFASLWLWDWHLVTHQR